MTRAKQFWKSMVVALQVKHMKDVHHHDAARRQEMGIRAPPQPLDHTITTAERVYVAELHGDNDAFCRCSVCSREISKSCSVKHFTSKKHALEPEVVKTWLVVSDGTALRSGRGHKLRLSAALPAASPTDVADTDEEVDAVAANLAI